MTWSLAESRDVELSKPVGKGLASGFTDVDDEVIVNAKVVRLALASSYEVNAREIFFWKITAIRPG
ncbi:hypothetical protein [Pseudomonas sp. TE12234]